MTSPASLVRDECVLLPVEFSAATTAAWFPADAADLEGLLLLLLNKALATFIAASRRDDSTVAGDSGELFFHESAVSRTRLLVPVSLSCSTNKRFPKRERVLRGREAVLLLVLLRTLFQSTIDFPRLIFSLPKSWMSFDHAVFLHWTAMAQVVRVCVFACVCVLTTHKAPPPFWRRSWQS